MPSIYVMLYVIPVGFRCNCYKDYVGTFCSFYLNTCSSSPCIRSSTCLNKVI